MQEKHTSHRLGRRPQCPPNSYSLLSGYNVQAPNMVLVLGAASRWHVTGAPSTASCVLAHPQETLREGKPSLKGMADSFFPIHAFPFPKTAGSDS